MYILPNGKYIFKKAHTAEIWGSSLIPPSAALPGAPVKDHYPCANEISKLTGLLGKLQMLGSASYLLAPFFRT